MYSIVTREDTIRIPAEYIRAGRNLVDHIDELANDAFEGLSLNNLRAHET